MARTSTCRQCGKVIREDDFFCSDLCEEAYYNMEEKDASVDTSLESPCPKADDKIHCQHWWEGDPCCTYGAPEMSDEKKREQGMIE